MKLNVTKLKHSSLCSLSTKVNHRSKAWLTASLHKDEPQSIHSQLMTILFPYNQHPLLSKARPAFLYVTKVQSTAGRVELRCYLVDSSTSFLSSHFPDFTIHLLPIIFTSFDITTCHKSFQRPTWVTVSQRPHCCGSILILLWIT